MSWMTEAWKIFRSMPRPASSRDIADRTGMSERLARKCIARLLGAGCLEFVYGSRRTGGYHYRAVPGVPLPTDQRGLTERAQEALTRARELRRRASRPISQVTAARLKCSS